MNIKFHLDQCYCYSHESRLGPVFSTQATHSLRPYIVLLNPIFFSQALYYTIGHYIKQCNPTSSSKTQTEKSISTTVNLRKAISCQISYFPQKIIFQAFAPSVMIHLFHLNQIQSSCKRMQPFSPKRVVVTSFEQRLSLKPENYD